MSTKWSLSSESCFGSGRGGCQATLCHETHTRPKDRAPEHKGEGVGHLPDSGGKERGGRERF